MSPRPPPPPPPPAPAPPISHDGSSAHALLRAAAECCACQQWGNHSERYRFAKSLHGTDTPRVRDATAAALAGVALPPKGRPAASGARSLGTRVLPVFVLSLESWASGGDDDDGYADHLLFERALFGLCDKPNAYGLSVSPWPVHGIPCGTVSRAVSRAARFSCGMVTPTIPRARHTRSFRGTHVPKHEACHPTPHGIPGRYGPAQRHRTVVCAYGGSA